MSVSYRRETDFRALLARRGFRQLEIDVLLDDIANVAERPTARDVICPFSQETLVEAGSIINPLHWIELIESRCFDNVVDAY